MTLFDKIFLWLFLLGSPFYRKMNVNISHLKAILKAKLTMDNRRPSTFEQMQKRKEQKELNKTSLQTMFGSLAIGSLLLISFAIGSDLTTKLTFFFTLFIFLLAATLISDFTSVLIDIKDNMIILPKPVNDATFVTSRLLHIAIHLNKILLPMLLPAIILFFIKGNRVVVIPFIFMAFIAALLSIFLINAIYILILKITTPERFRSIISYIQIGLAIAIYGSYQLVPRLMEASVGRSLQVSQLKYIRLFPPFWFAETCKSFSVFSFGNMQLLSLALSIIIPLLSMLVVVKYLAPAFTQKLSMINSSAVEIKNADVKTRKSRKGKSSFIESVAAKLTTSGSEFMGFLFTWKMMSRSREFKIKVYPFFGYIAVILILIILKNRSVSLSEITELSSKGKSFFIILIYFCSLISISALGQISYSEKFKASWIFHVTPINLPGPVLTGALKSVILSFVFPFVLFIILFGIPIFGVKIIPNLLLGCINVLVICSLMAYFIQRKLPFSQSPIAAGGGSNFINSLITLILPAFFGFFHLLIFNLMWVVIASGLIGIIIIRMVFFYMKQTKWEKLN